MRITAFEAEHLARLDRSHVLERCPFVESMLAGTGVPGAVAMRAEPWWTDGRPFEDDEIRGRVRAKDAVIGSGEDPPGSWHQQANGGRRIWLVAHGEMAWR